MFMSKEIVCRFLPITKFVIRVTEAASETTPISASILLHNYSLILL